MQLEVGEIVEGKVSGVTKFGAFVSLPGGQSGLVHISEIANSFVSDINQFVQTGMIVKVKVLGINNGKINLSMKKAEEQPKRPQSARKPEPVQNEAERTADDQGFEDILKKFMKESDSRIAGNPMYADRSKNRRRR